MFLASFKIVMVNEWILLLNYLRKIDLIYNGVDSLTLNWFDEVFNKLRYYRRSPAY